MTIETRIFRLLSSDKEFVRLLKRLRKIDDEESGIWKHEIPENYQKQELAPFIRINPIFEADREFQDDMSAVEEQRVLISWWCVRDAQSEEIKEALDKIMMAQGFTRYTANENPRYRDTDIGLLMNNRKYRYFDWKN